MALGQLGPRQGQNEQGMVPGPVQEILDEVHQGRLGPLHVLEHEDCGVDVGQPLEEQPRGCEQFLAVA